MFKTKNNKFGTGVIHSTEDMVGEFYITSAACMTVFTETSAWANVNRNRVVWKPEQADFIVVLSCQVTDLAILNDLKVLRELMKKYPDKQYFIGGCLAQRFDIELPEGVMRMDHLREDYSPVSGVGLVNYEKPFWVPDFDEGGEETDDGHLFRNMYPLRVGSGCHGKCKYCTIKVTRGKAYDLDPKLLEEEFSKHDDILIVADSVTVKQIKEYSLMALRHRKSISFRNVEPQNLVAGKEALITLALNGLLKIIHTPVQATSKKTLEIMNRDIAGTCDAISVVRILKDLGAYTATNIIIDYDGCENDFAEVYDLFDYVSWNPYWNGVWNEEEAEIRWKKYILKESHNV
jgi:tRNA A37 methylthiotransferase MiaB